MLLSLSTLYADIQKSVSSSSKSMGPYPTVTAPTATMLPPAIVISANVNKGQSIILDPSSSETSPASVAAIVPTNMPMVCNRVIEQALTSKLKFLSYFNIKERNMVLQRNTRCSRFHRVPHSDSHDLSAVQHSDWPNSNPSNPRHQVSDTIDCAEI